MYGAIKVEFRSGLAPEFVQTEMIDNVEYFNIFELNKVFEKMGMKNLSKLLLEIKACTLCEKKLPLGPRAIYTISGFV